MPHALLSNLKALASKLPLQLTTLPFRFHWLMVTLMAVVIPWLTKGTDKPGEFYPFSNFPMYSSFSPDTYFVWISDLNDQPVPIGPTFGLAPSDVKKTYDRKLSELKTEAPRGLRKVELPVELKRRAGRETLEGLIQAASQPETVAGYPGFRLHHVDIRYEDGTVTQQTSRVGEVVQP